MALTFKTNALTAASLGLFLAASSVALAQPIPPPPPLPPGQAYPYPPAPPAPPQPPPPPEVIAVAQPVYYQGHPTYWYNGHWYWREGQDWRRYDNEPQELHDHRQKAPPPRYHYEPHHR